VQRSKKLFITSGIMLSAAIASWLLPDPENAALKEFKEDIQVFAPCGCSLMLAWGSNVKMTEITDKAAEDYRNMFKDENSDLNL